MQDHENDSLAATESLKNQNDHRNGVFRPKFNFMMAQMLE